VVLISQIGAELAAEDYLDEEDGRREIRTRIERVLVRGLDDVLDLRRDEQWLSVLPCESKKVFFF